MKSGWTLVFWVGADLENHVVQGKNSATSSPQQFCEFLQRWATIHRFNQFQGLIEQRGMKNIVNFKVRIV
jgi:hypothetical protein